jgi:acetyl esterase/lipase
MKTDYSLSTGATVSLYPTTEEEAYLLYFHGGGFVYGSRQDIPSPLIDLFHEHNYTILSMDYLLAPNSSLSEIIDTAWENFLELKEKIIKDRPYRICGRSAGGYLMLALTKRILAAGLAMPESLINFYGYTDFAFITTSRQSNQPPLAESLLPKIELKEKVWDDPQFQRYLFYIYALQQQTLTEVYGIFSDRLADYALTAEELQHFPPVFSTASSTDEEVPFRYSKALKKIPGSKFTAVYDLPHDFLKETDNEQVQMVFARLSVWLNEH